MMNTHTDPHTNYFTILGGMLLGVALILMIAVGAWVAQGFGGEDIHIRPALPDCEEDEVLAPTSYPYHDAGDLACLHIDNIAR